MSNFKLVNILFFLFISYTVKAQWKNVSLTTISFKIKNAGIGVDGKFGKIISQLFIDESNPSKSTFTGTVESNSISTGIQLRDNHLKDKDEFFNVVKYPTIVMKSVSVVVKNKGIYNVTWDLTIKGVTRRFSTEVLTKVDGNNMIVSTQFKINRNDWNIGGSSLTMGDAVTVKLNARLTK